MTARRLFVAVPLVMLCVCAGWFVALAWFPAPTPSIAVVAISGVAFAIQAFAAWRWPL